MKLEITMKELKLKEVFNRFVSNVGFSMIAVMLLAIGYGLVTESGETIRVIFVLLGASAVLTLFDYVLDFIVSKFKR